MSAAIRFIESLIDIDTVFLTRTTRLISPKELRTIEGVENYMPVVTVNLWPGRDDDAKQRIAEGITQVLERENIPRDAVDVIIYEVPKNNWAKAGKLFSSD